MQKNLQSNRKPIRKKQENRFKNTNLIIALSMILLTFIGLFAGGVIKLKTPSMDSVKTVLSTQMKEEKMTEGTDRDLKKNYGIDTDSLSEFIYYPPKSSMDASEVIVLKVKNTSDLEGIQEKIKARKAKQIDSFKNYKPEEAAILENSILRVSGDFVIFISSKNVQSIDRTIQKAF
ncbi:MAG: DUF4358 domain-containing protein [Clostridiaceae bacterium]